MIAGNLRHLPLSEVFQIIVTGQKSGVLSVVHEGKRSRIIFELGRVQYAYCIPGLHLAEILVRMELLTAYEAQVLYKHLDEKTSNLGIYAIEQGYVEEEALKQALKIYLTETLTYLLGWKAGSFKFTEKSTVVSHLPPTYSFEAMSLLMEVIRRHDEWQKGLAQASTIYQKIGNPTSLSLVEGSWEVLGLINGQRSARSIAAEMDMPEEQVYRILYLLEEQGILSKSSFQANEPFILLVSKSQFLQRLIHLALRRIAVTPLIASTDENAVMLAEQERPRVIIIDKVDEGSWDLVKDLRQLLGFSKTPIIMLESESDSVGILKRWNRPKVTKLLKPFEEIDLQQLVSQFIGRAFV